MKLLLSALFSVALVSSAAYAAGDLRDIPEYNCTSSFGASGPVKGYSLNVAANDVGTYTGILYPNCPACRVQPTYLSFTRKVTRGMTLVYSGGDSKLVISLESLLPTRSHPAQLQTPSLNDGKPVDFTCVAADQE